MRGNFFPMRKTRRACSWIRWGISGLRWFIISGTKVGLFKAQWGKASDRYAIPSKVSQVTNRLSTIQPLLSFVLTNVLKEKNKCNLRRFFSRQERCGYVASTGKWFGSCFSSSFSKTVFNSSAYSNKTSKSGCSPKSRNADIFPRSSS